MKKWKWESELVPGPRDTKSPKSREYAIQSVMHLRTLWQSQEADLRRWEEELARAKRHEIWKALEYADLNALLQDAIGHTERQSICHFEAREAKRGRPGKTSTVEDLGQRGRAERNGIGIQTQVWLDRLARDRTDLLARVQSGELKVKQAARMAGIIKEPTAFEQIKKLVEKLRPQLTAAKKRELRSLLR